MSLDCHCHNLPSTVMQSNQANQLVYLSNEISSFFPFFGPLCMAHSLYEWMWKGENAL